MKLNILENICFCGRTNKNEEESKLDHAKSFGPRKPSFPSYNNDLCHYTTNIYTNNNSSLSG